MKYKLIGCEVFSKPAYLAAAKSQAVIDMEFTRLRSHLKPEELRTAIQDMIDRSGGQYDAILLGYGLCGNSTAGIKSRSVPLVIPRAHDCCTIFLGSKEAFREHFGETPSAQWITACYYERAGNWYADNAASILLPGQDRQNEEKGTGDSYAELVEKYGEENAQYIWESLNIHAGFDFLTYIDIPGIMDDSEIRERFAEHARQIGKTLRFIEGGTRLIDKLLAGDWNSDEFLLVPPGSEIKPVYDFDRVMDI